MYIPPRIYSLYVTRRLLCASDLSFFAARLPTPRCWTADAVALICFLFGLEFVGAEDDDAVVVIVVVGSDSLFSEVKSDSDAESSSMPTKMTSRRFLFAPPFCARRRRTCWRTISIALSDFENPTRIMAPGTLTPVVVWRIRTAESTFLCAALFLRMFGYGVYSVGTDYAKQCCRKVDPSRVASHDVRKLSAL
jgi:hypothetical protein